MPARLFRLYQRKRIVNVNANVVLAGIAAILVAKYPVKLAGNWLTPERAESLLSFVDRDFLMTIVAALIDGAADILIYFVLHWVANHWRPLRPKTEQERRVHDAAKKESFFKDATLIQFERAMLLPLFYPIAMGLMWLLLKAGVADHWGFSIGFITAIITTRIVHTVWGVRSGSMLDADKRERKRRLRMLRRKRQSTAEPAGFGDQLPEDLTPND